MRDAKGLHDIHEKEIEVPVTGPGETEQNRGDEHQKEIWGEDSACAALIEVPEVSLETVALGIEEDAGDQEAGEDEEEVDPHPQQSDPQEVVDKDGTDREGSNAVQLINSFRH